MDMNDRKLMIALYQIALKYILRDIEDVYSQAPAKLMKGATAILREEIENYVNSKRENT